MSVALLSPVVRIDVAQRILKDIFEAALVPHLLREVVWGVTNESRPARPYGFFDWLTGPAQLNAITTETSNILTDSKHFLDFPPTPIVGDVHALYLNAQLHRHVVVGGDTSESIRDIFIASINADGEPASASIVSATRLLVETTVPAGLWSFDVAFPLVTSVDPSGIAQCAKLHHQRNGATVSLSLYTEDTRISVGAMQIAARLSIVLDLAATLDTLADAGLAVMQIAEPVNDTALTSGGAKYEGISTIDYQLGVPSYFPEPNDNIESVVTSIVIGSRTIPLAIPA